MCSRLCALIALLLTAASVTAADTCACPILEAYVLAGLDKGVRRTDAHDVTQTFDFEAGMTPVAATIHDSVWNGWTPSATLQNLPSGDISYSGTKQFPSFVSIGVETEFAVRLRAKIDIPTTGEYDFKAKTDDGFLLYIDRTLIIGKNLVQCDRLSLPFPPTPTPTHTSTHTRLHTHTLPNT